MVRTAPRVAIAALAAARVTRFLYQDVLGEDLVVGPLRRLRDRLPDNGPSEGLTGKVVEAMDCPYCSSVWVTSVAVGLATRGRGMPLVERAGLALASAYVVGHLVDALDSPKEV